MKAEGQNFDLTIKVKTVKNILNSGAVSERGLKSQDTNPNVNDLEDIHIFTA